MPQANQGEDAARLTEAWQEIAEQSQRVALAFIERQGGGDGFSVPDARVVSDAMTAFAAAALNDPQVLLQAQIQLWQGMGELWQQQMRLLMGEPAPPIATPSPGDRRFKDEAWSEERYFDFVKQSYLLTARCLQGLVGEVDGLEPKMREKVDFYTRQFVDAMAPTNFVATNPTVLKQAAETKGESLLMGYRHLLDDLERGKGDLAISMTKQEAFKVGENIASSPGKVIYQNALMQLIQYSPSTGEVFKRPLLIVPPWINKFYILDLKPKNSFIKFAVDQGHTVFVISWVNPDAALADKTFEHYMLEGPLTAMAAIEKATGEREICIIGYCLGGTLTACLLAWMAVQGDERIKAATFFTCLTDFSEPGELAVFIDDEQISFLEEHMREKGYLEAKHMQQVFNLLRANDLIWSFVVNNYLMGREPMAFDLLYWNADSTRMPCMMHSFYLRNMYQKNLLAQAGGITLAGAAIDLGRIKVPTYFLSTREDHIAPWKGTYKGSRLFGSSVRFVLGGSGHIAGVINPPGSGKYGYWTGTRRPADPEAWLAAAEPHEGSWWPDWAAWVARRSGAKVPARQPGDGDLPAIEDAPGRFVRIRAVD